MLFSEGRSEDSILFRVRLVYRYFAVRQWALLEGALALSASGQFGIFYREF